MANALTGAGQTFDVLTANREDLLDIITIISPTQTPFYSSVGKGTASATLHEWLTDSLTPVVADAGLIEGADPTYPLLDLPVRLSNYVQIFQHPYSVSYTQEAVDKAGKQSEMAYQATKKMKEHARDTEYACFANTTVGNAGAVGASRLMKPIGDFISNSLDAVAVVLDEDTHLNTMLETIWTAGGDPDTLFCSAAVKRRISGFAANSRTRNLDVGEQADKRLVATIEIYESDFGVLRLVADRFLPVTAGAPDTSPVFILEMNRWRFDYLINPKDEELAHTGSAYRRWIYAEGCVINLSPEASGTIINVKNTIA